MTSKTLKTTIRASWMIILLVGALAGLASAQGINVTLRANANPFPAHDRYANVWGDGDFAYVGSYFSNGVCIFDITNPDAPILAANYTDSGFDSQLEDVEVQNGIGFFASNFNGGIHIVNLSNPYAPKLITRITSAQGGWDSVHTLLVNGDYLYVPHFLVDPNMQVWDISNPSAPVLKWTFLTTDPDSIRQSSILGNRLYTSGRGGHTDIWDITNIASEPPQLLGTIMSGSLSHSSSPTPDGDYLVASRELNANGGDVRIYNVQNPADPTEVSLITMPEFGIESVSPHNPAVVGNLLYHSWYDAGMKVFDITNRANPILVGSYNTWNSTITPNQYDGDWGIYPYLGQDRILASDQDHGLFILDATGVNSNPVIFNYLVNPPGPTFPSPVTGAPPAVSGAATGEVYITGVAPAGGLFVSLSASGPVISGTSVRIPAGAHSTTVSLSTSPVSTSTAASVTASANSVSATGLLTVVPGTVSSFTVNPSPAVGGVIAVGKVVLSSAATAQTAVNIAVVSGGTALSSIPSLVHVADGGTYVTFQIVTKAVTSTVPVTLSATVGAETVQTTFNVTAGGSGPAAPSAVTFTPATVLGNGATTPQGTVTVKNAVSTNTTINLAVTSGAAAINSIPATVVVPAGATSATFPVTTNTVASATSAKISATTSAGTATGSLTVNAPAPVTVEFLTSPVTGGNSTEVRVIMQQIVVANTTITLTVTSGAAAVASIPATVDVSPGHNTVVFTLGTKSVTANTAIAISAAGNGGTASGTETVNAP
jgi:hypothetical protein